MQLLIIILVAFVIFMSVHAILRHRKRRKRELKEEAENPNYKRRLDLPHARQNLDNDDFEFVTKYNSRIDYRAPGGKAAKENDEDYSSWGE
jgi:FtsZ-interacting cell division protein ZipA